MIPWIQVYSNLPTHPKIDKLAEAIKQSNYATVGIMVCIWSWVTMNAPDGDLSAYPNPRKRIEEVVGWTNKKINLYEALIDTRWIDATDGKITIHDWNEYSAKGFEEKRKTKNAERQQKHRDKNKNNVTDNADSNVTHNADSNVTKKNDSVTHNVMSRSTIHNNTEHNNTIHNISPLTPPEGNDVTDVTGTPSEMAMEREKKEEINVNEFEEETSEQSDPFEGYKAHWREMMGMAVDSDIPKQAYMALLRAAINKIEPELVGRMIGMSATKETPSAWFATVIDNLIDDDITTCEEYTKRYGGKKQTESETVGGSFDTDEFFELAVQRTYEGMGK